MKSASTLPVAAAVDPQQERRSLRVRSRHGGGGGIAASGGGGTIIIVVVICATAVALLVIGCGLWKLWSVKKKTQNPSWRFRDYFKRKTPAAERGEAMLHETPALAEEAAVPAAHDNPRVNLGSKSRKQAAAASREP